MAAPDLSAVIEMAACSDPGKVRSNNEDSVLTYPRLGLAVLADGMGGYNAGEVASGMATSVLGSELEHAFVQRPPQAIMDSGVTWAQEALVSVISRTNSAIHQAAQANPKYYGMGTTLVATLFFDNRLIVAHVGDSRLYRLRANAMIQVTRDHSLLQEQIDSGIITPEQARFSQNKNLVTRAMGVENAVDTEVAVHEVLPGDIFLLCSDGLNDMVEDGEIELTLATLAANLPLCAAQLVDAANDHGGRDNVSVILVRIREAFPADSRQADWLGRVRSWFG